MGKGWRRKILFSYGRKWLRPAADRTVPLASPECQTGNIRSWSFAYTGTPRFPISPLASVSFKGYHRQRRRTGIAFRWCLCCVLFISVFPQSPHRLSASSPPPRARRRNEPGVPPDRQTRRPLPCPCCPRGSPRRTQAGCQTGSPPEPENRLSVGFTMASTRIWVMSL